MQTRLVRWGGSTALRIAPARPLYRLQDLVAAMRESALPRLIDKGGPVGSEAW